MKYVVLEYGQDSDRLMLRELTDRPDVELCFWREPLPGLWPRILRKLHTGSIWSRRLPLPGREYWHRELWEALAGADRLLILAFCLIDLDESFMRRVRLTNPGLKIVLLLWDSMHTQSSMMRVARPKILGFGWDLVLSFDRADCEEFGFAWLGWRYYSKLAGVAQRQVSSDICFVGAGTAGREALLSGIAARLQSAGGQADFTLVPHLSLMRRLAAEFVPRCRKRSLQPGLELRYMLMPYAELLARELNSNCLLELVQPGQKQQTLRYLEAVVYNKKLLTNNAYARELPFYDERYMRVFGHPDEIDVGWVKERADVDYGYRDEFSPAKLPELIERELG